MASATSVQAQAVQQSGTVTPGHPARWITPGVIGDAGTATTGLLTGLGVTASGPAICQRSGSSGAYNRICLSATATSGGITLDNIGGATGGFTFSLNGVTQGLVTATLPVTANDSACFADSTGTIKDCGFAAGSVTSVALSMPSIFSVAGSPITTAGTLAVTLQTETANTVFAGPTTGSAAVPTFRVLVAADLPSVCTGTNHAVLVGTGSPCFNSLTVGVTGMLLAAMTGADPVFTSSPALTTSLTVPLIIGGSAVAQALTFQTTTGAGSGDTHVFIGGTAGAVTRMTLSSTALNLGSLVATLALGDNGSGQAVIAVTNGASTNASLLLQSKGTRGVSAVNSTSGVISSFDNNAGNTASTNYISLSNGASGTSPTIFANPLSTNTDVNILYLTKGAGSHLFETGAGSVLFSVDASGNGAFTALVQATQAKLTSTVNQLVLQAGGVTGTLSWTPASTNKIITFPNGTTDFSATGGTSQVVKQTSANGAFTVARLACSDLSDAAATCSSTTGGSLVVGSTTITSGTTTRVLYDNAGVLGEYTITGTGTVVAMQTSPSFTTPALGAATGASLVLTGAGASILAAGLNGATNPALQVDASTASSATGLKIKSAAAAGGLALSVITSGTNENLTVNAAGSGTITLGSVSTGAIVHTTATTLSAALTYGGVTLSNAVTGTGNMALSASPTFTGTIVAASASLTGTITFNGATSGSSVVRVAAIAGTGSIFQLPADNGANGQVLQTDGTGITSWIPAGGTGTVTSVACGTGLSGGTITTTGTCTITTSTTDATNNTTAALVLAGGLAIGATKSMYVGTTLISPNGFDNGIGVSTGTVTMSLAGSRSGDGLTSLNLYSSSAVNSFAINRFGGVNGVAEMNNRGTGSFTISQVDAGLIAIATNSTTRVSIASGGTVTISSGLLAVTSMANVASSNAVCYNTGTGAITYATTCTVSALANKNPYKPLTNQEGLDLVMSMEPWRYTLKEGLPSYVDGEQIGFIADDAAKKDPRVVSFKKDGSVEGFKYEQYTAALTAAFKYLKADNDNLRMELDEFKQALGK